LSIRLLWHLIPRDFRYLPIYMVLVLGMAMQPTGAASVAVVEATCGLIPGTCFMISLFCLDFCRTPHRRRRDSHSELCMPWFWFLGGVDAPSTCMLCFAAVWATVIVAITVAFELAAFFELVDYWKNPTRPTIALTLLTMAPAIAPVFGTMCTFVWGVWYSFHEHCSLHLYQKAAFGTWVILTGLGLGWYMSCELSYLLIPWKSSRFSVLSMVLGFIGLCFVPFLGLTEFAKWCPHVIASVVACSRKTKKKKKAADYSVVENDDIVVGVDI